MTHNEMHDLLLALRADLQDLKRLIAPQQPKQKQPATPDKNEKDKHEP